MQSYWRPAPGNTSSTGSGLVCSSKTRSTLCASSEWGSAPREGLEHEGINLRRQGQTLRIAITESTGRHVTIYAQQELVKDLLAALLDRGERCALRSETSESTGSTPSDPQSRTRATARTRSSSASSSGGDGSHGCCRPSGPAGVLTEHEFDYRFAWLGILAEAHPATDELIYAWHERGFALHSMRSPEVSRLYIQVSTDEEIEGWPDQRIWEELQARLASPGWQVNEGPIVDKVLTPMRTLVREPMQFGRLFLLGDAAHIVPPTGAKGLNLAVNTLACSPLPWRIGTGKVRMRGSSAIPQPRYDGSGVRRTSPTT